MSYSYDCHECATSIKSEKRITGIALCDNCKVYVRLTKKEARFLGHVLGYLGPDEVNGTISNYISSGDLTDDAESVFTKIQNAVENHGELYYGPGSE